MRNALLTLVERRRQLTSDYRVSLEATHHGPTELDVPVWFVEIGSSEAQWKDDEAGEAAAEAVWASLSPSAKGKAAVGFGGGHYSPKHTELCVETNYAVGHIFPKYSFTSGIDEGVLSQAFSKTWGGCTVAAVDWKGLRGDHRRVLLEKLEAMGIEEIIRV